MGVVLDIVIVAAVAGLALWAALSLRRDRRKGCRGGCGGCPYAGECQEKKHE